jgi:hypothetical protein
MNPSYTQLNSENYISKSIRLFVTENDPWQWTLILEYIHSYTMSKDSVIVYYVEYNLPGTVKDRIKRLFGWKGSRETISKILSEYKVPIVTIKATNYFQIPSLRHLKALESEFYPGIVAVTGTRKLLGFRNRFLSAKLLTRAYRITKSIEKNFSDDYQGLVMVPNGKIISASAIVRTLRALGQKVQILESGATPSRLQVWEHSAQSQSEADILMAQMWGNAAERLRDQIAISYFKDRRDSNRLDPYHNVSWASLTMPMLLPSIEPNKKVVTFYSSSQIEQVGADPIPEGNFKNQGEALLALLQLLDPREWIVFLRKHPIPNGSKTFFDDENDIWQTLESFTHLRIIDSKSKVDSFALASVSEFVLHFNSSIGPEIIYAQLAPVITTGPTSWTSLRAGFTGTSFKELEEVLMMKNITKSNPKDVLPWGYFHAQFGSEFKVVTLEKGKWTLKGRVLHPTFKSYLLGRLRLE